MEPALFREQLVEAHLALAVSSCNAAIGTDHCPIARAMLPGKDLKHRSKFVTRFENVLYMSGSNRFSVGINFNEL